MRGTTCEFALIFSTVNPVVTMEPLNPLTLGQCALKVTDEIHHNSGLYWPWNLEGLLEKLPLDLEVNLTKMSLGFGRSI